MKRFSIAIIAAAGILACPVQAQTRSIGTTPAGSFTNSVGNAVAKAIVEHAGLRATVSPQQSHGQEAGHDGSAEGSLATLSDVQMYVTGTVDWEGKGPKKNIRLISRLVPITTVFYVRLDSSVKSLGDLKGKRVSVGYGAQKAVHRVVLALLATVGVPEKEVQGVPAGETAGGGGEFWGAAGARTSVAGAAGGA